jgi:hypothetical protein
VKDLSNHPETVVQLCATATGGALSAKVRKHATNVTMDRTRRMAVPRFCATRGEQVRPARVGLCPPVSHDLSSQGRPFGRVLRSARQRTFLNRTPGAGAEQVVGPLSGPRSRQERSRKLRGDARDLETTRRRVSNPAGRQINSLRHVGQYSPQRPRTRQAIEPMSELQRLSWKGWWSGPESNRRPSAFRSRVASTSRQLRMLMCHDLVGPA